MVPRKEVAVRTDNSASFIESKWTETIRTLRRTAVPSSQRCLATSPSTYCRKFVPWRTKQFVGKWESTWKLGSPHTRRRSSLLENTMAESRHDSQHILHIL